MGDDDTDGNAYGLQCPKCGNTDQINIGVRVWVTVIGEQVQDPYERSKYAHEAFDGWNWDQDDKAQCPECEHEGTVADFQQK